MRALLQRVTNAAVTIDDRQVAAIGNGLLVLLGIEKDDTESDGAKLAQKIVNLRIFADDTRPMNRSLLDTKGSLLVVSQFTLLADTQKGNRPSFNDAAPPAEAKHLYEKFLQQIQALVPTPVASGQFAAHMQITLTNDGPVTIPLDTRR